MLTRISSSKHWASNKRSTIDTQIRIITALYAAFIIILTIIYTNFEKIKINSTSEYLRLYILFRGILLQSFEFWNVKLIIPLILK